MKVTMEVARAESFNLFRTAENMDVQAPIPSAKPRNQVADHAGAATQIQRLWKNRKPRESKEKKQK